MMPPATGGAPATVIFDGYGTAGPFRFISIDAVLQNRSNGVPLGDGEGLGVGEALGDGLGVGVGDALGDGVGQLPVPDTERVSIHQPMPSVASSDPKRNRSFMLWPFTFGPRFATVFI